MGLLFVVPAATFDTVVGVLLNFGLYRSSGRYGTSMPLVRLIMRDGLLYFLVVFASNITWIVVHIILQQQGRHPGSVRIYIPRFSENVKLRFRSYKKAILHL